MAIKTLDKLINKLDGFEIIGDVIALILVENITRQKILAIEESLDPALWDIKIFRERNNPLESFRDNEDAVPEINIWVDTIDFPKAKSDDIERQLSSTIYNIDCYALGTAENVIGGGHTPGDEAAAVNVSRTVRLARNILMAAQNRYLQNQGLVWGRWINSITFYQPEFNTNNALQLQAARIRFNADFNEFSPQFEGETLETVFTELKLAEDGSILSEVEINY